MASADEAATNNGPEAAPEAPNFEFDFDMGAKPGSTDGARAENTAEEPKSEGAQAKKPSVDEETAEKFFSLMKTACAQAQHGYDRLPPGPLQDASFRTVGAAQQVFAQCLKMDPERAHREWQDYTGRAPTQKMIANANNIPAAKPRDALDSLTTTVQATGTEVSLLTTDQRIQEIRKLCLASEGPVEDAKARAVDNIHGAWSRMAPEVPSNTDSGMFLIKAFFDGKKAGHQRVQGKRQNSRAKAMLKDVLADRAQLKGLLDHRKTIQMGHNKTDSTTPTSGPLGSASAAMKKTGTSKFTDLAKVVVEATKNMVRKTAPTPSRGPTAADLHRQAAAQGQGMGIGS